MDCSVTYAQYLLTELVKSRLVEKKEVECLHCGTKVIVYDPTRYLSDEEHWIKFIKEES